jgi:hypothetical protein
MRQRETENGSDKDSGRRRADYPSPTRAPDPI